MLHCGVAAQAAHVVMGSVSAGSYIPAEAPLSYVI